MDIDDRRTMFVVYMIVIGITGLLFTTCVANPQFDSKLQYVQISENTSIGTLLFNLTAIDRDNPVNQLNIFTNDEYTNQYVNITQENKTSPVTAKIFLKKLLDRESNEAGIELKIFLSDTKGNTILKVIRVYITDTCDERPQFDRPSYSVEIDEKNITMKTLVFDGIHATDRDNGNNALVTYEMEPKTQSDYWMDIYNEMFKMDPTNGNVYLLKNLSYEDNTFYQYTLHAHDPCNLMAEQVDLTIKVKDVQDKPPFFIKLPYMRIIPEGNYSNTEILRIEAFDGDLGIPNKVKYSLVNTSECSNNVDIGCIFCKKLFTINSSTGDIRITGNLDWEMDDVLDIYGTCNIEVEAEEIQKPNVTQLGDTKSKTNVTVTIQDENNHSPKFANTSFSATIQENANPNTPILLDGGATGIDIYDKDQGPNSKFSVTIECENEKYCKTFAVVPSNPMFREGAVTIRVNNNSLLDYEKRQKMTLTVIAMEDKNSSHTDTATVIVNIENVNEFSPEFENKIYEARIKEGSGTGTLVINVTATDKDRDIFGKVTYSLSGGSDLFSVDNETGQVITNCHPWQLDREQIPKIYLTIIGTDGGGRMNQAQIIVNLKDVNDNPPLFQQHIYSAFIEENSTDTLATQVLTVMATDADQNGTNNSEVSYSIGNTTWNSNFTINSKTGEIRLVSVLDYEELNETFKGRINLTVFAYDNGTPQYTSNVTVTILVQDKNDNAPSFSMKIYNGSVKENSTNGTLVGKVNAIDADKTERNKMISYAIETGGFDNFRINSTTGNVTVQVGAHFDRDIINLYNLTIIAIDQGMNPFTATATMRVTIEDVNNKPPSFNQSSYSIRTLENMTDGSFLTNCIATDKDENAWLSYSINKTMGWDENGLNVSKSIIETYFRIENGTLYVNDSLDREKVERLEVTLSVHDTNEEENKPQTATTTLTVTLLDVNDNDPYFVNDFHEGHVEYYETNVSENANNPTILMSVSATDKDRNRTITYKIFDSTLNLDLHNSAFKIDPKTGEISKIGEVDRENTTAVNLTVTAIDNGYPPRNSSVKVLITILDFNDNTPQFLHFRDELSVLENVTIGTIIETISATDADEGENGRVEYEIEKGENLPFRINLRTGTIYVSKDLDRETVSEYILTILVKDNPNNTKSQLTNRTIIRIMVDDVNDNDPKFPDKILTTRTPENTAVRTEIFTITATDADEGYNANVTFSIVNKTNVGGYFDIDNTGRNQGRVFIAKSLDDSEEWRNITVLATDHGVPQRSSTTILHIAVLDVNLHAPKLGQVLETISVFECAYIGTEIFRINATDGDKTSPNNEVHFNMSIIQPQNNTNIQINKTTGQVFVAANLSVSQISSYKVQLMAVDQGTPNLTSSVKVIDIKVDDVNDQPPRFVNSWFSFSVEEEQRNRAINQVVSFDPDKNSNSCYSLKDLGSYRGYFTINRTGYILVEEPLDRENKSQQIITFEVKVYDCTEVVNVSEQCGNSYQLKYNSSDTANVTITVLDIDDNRPEFTGKNLRAGIRTKSEPGKEILELKSYVNDKDLPQNAIYKWFFEKVSLTMDPKLTKVLKGQKSGEGCNEALCVTANGTIVNNMWYTQDMSGFFNLSVRVNDSAGNDTTYILIFLIADSQVLKMSILGNRTAVALIKDEILRECSSKIDITFVYDSIADHITDDGNVESFKTDLFFHIENPVKNEVLSAEEAKRLLDSNADKLVDVRINRNIISIESSLKAALPESESTKTIYVLVAVVGVLTLVILIMAYMFFSSSNRYKRKLRAAMPMENEMNILTNKDLAAPGSNIYANRKNPLINAEPAPPGYDEIDDTSQNSLDKNDVDANAQIMETELEEREETLDMYCEDYHSMPTIDPLEAALREHDAQRQAAVHRRDDSDEVVNYGYLHELELETSEI